MYFLSSLNFDIYYKMVKYNELSIKTITVKPFVQSPLNDRDPLDFVRGLEKEYIGFRHFNILINSLYLSKKDFLVKDMF